MQVEIGNELVLIEEPIGLVLVDVPHISVRPHAVGAVQDGRGGAWHIEFLEAAR